MIPARILVADDHPIVREGLRSRLAAQGPAWEVCAVAKTGPEAVSKAASFKPDIAVLSYQLPQLNGLEAAAQIGQRVPGTEVLLFTKTRSPGVLQRIYHSNVRGCMLQSETLDDLTTALRSVRAHRRFRSRALTKVCDGLEVSPGARVALTRRQMEILRLICEDHSTKDIASQLGVSVKTIDVHRTNLMHKFEVRSVAGLVRDAIYHGIVGS